MKTLCLAIAMSVFLVGVAAAQDNRIGIYTTQDADPTHTIYDGGANEFFDVYVIVHNPTNTVTGEPLTSIAMYQMHMVMPDMVAVTNTYPAGTANFGTPPDYLCFTDIPVVDGKCTLLTMTLLSLAATPDGIYLEDLWISDVQTGDKYPAYPSSGDPGLPVFGLWSSVVPDQDVSWSGVHNLFR